MPSNSKKQSTSRHRNTAHLQQHVEADKEGEHRYVCEAGLGAQEVGASGPCHHPSCREPSLPVTQDPCKLRLLGGL